MIAGFVRFVSIVASVLVLLGFALFVLDEAGRGSEEQQSKLAEQSRPDPTPRGERDRERENSAARELVDDANDVLLRPFADILDSDDRWVARGFPALLGLLVYGLLIGLLVPSLRKLP